MLCVAVASECLCLFGVRKIFSRSWTEYARLHAQRRHRSSRIPEFGNAEVLLPARRL